ncbi:hypothetical protein ACSBR2_031970 [Camellia fascicularis]
MARLRKRSRWRHTVSWLKMTEWLMKTSDSCTIVAALIATVASATSVSVPGGTKGHGEPVLGREPMFEIFSFSSLGTLCFSLTAVVMFLAIFTSRHQPTDFGCILPTKLLIGLTALFLSIASVLVSFCGEHFFIVRDILKDAKAVEYVVAVIPVLVFAIAQFPLYFKLIWATMNKVPQRGFMVTSGGTGAGGIEPESINEPQRLIFADSAMVLLVVLTPSTMSRLRSRIKRLSHQTSRGRISKLVNFLGFVALLSPLQF